MKTKLLRVLSIMLLLVTQVVFAQQKTVTGTISDENGVPLAGVNVIIEGTSTGTQTDFDGNYSINANVGQTLVYSYLSYTTTSKAVTASTSTMSFSMQPDADALGEVVITAIGLKKKKEDDLSSSTLVSVEAVTRSGESGVLQGLAGKTSGVNITRSSGDPGAGAYIQIRGANSINGSDEPLVVVDGVLIDNSNFGSGVDGVTEQSRLNDIAAEDIEDIRILKSAQAVAIYGTGAANGAILITTKSGKIGGAGTWKADYKAGVYVDEINEIWDLQDTFGQGINGNWRDTAGERNTWGDKISTRSGGPDNVDTSSIRRFEAEGGNIYYPIIDKNSRESFLQSNQDAILGTGYSFENSLSLQHSGKDGSTYISANTWKQDGIIQGNSSYYRRSFRFNNTTKYTEKLTGKISSSYTKTNGDAIQFGSNLNGLYLGFLRTSPDFDIRDYKGTSYNASGVPTLNAMRAYRNPLGPTSAYNNPLWTAREQENTQEVDRFTITPELSYAFTDNLTFITRYNIDTYRDNRREFIPVNSSSNVGSGNGYLSLDERFVNSQYFTALLNSTHDISDNFNLGWTLGMTYEESSLEQIGATLDGFTAPDIDLNDLIDIENGVAESSNPFDFYTYTKQIGAYALVEGEIFNQVLFQLTGRLDRSSTLNNQNFFYPGVSLGWKFTEAIGESNFLSFGKLRAAYGEVAVAPGAYSLSTGITIGGGVGSSWGDALNGAQYGSLTSRENNQGNPNLEVERVKEFEVGADFKLFNNNVNLGVTYYDRETTDVIIDKIVSSTTGFSSLTSNAANITNTGLEADISATLINNGKVKWNLFANYSYNRNLVTSPLSDPDEEITFLNGFTGTSAAVINGQPFSVLVGDPTQKDENGNLVLDENGFPQLDNESGQIVIGDPNADFRAGLGTSVEYKGFKLSAQFDMIQGNDVWNGTRGVLNHFGVSQETANEVTVSAAQAASIVNYDGTPINQISYATQNPDGSYTVRGNLEDFGAGTVLLDQIYYNEGHGSGFAGASDIYVEDASYVKLRELTLGYSFSKKVAESVGLRSIDLAISGRNLITWTDIEGFDPDNNLTGASKGRGLEYFTNPSTSSYSFILRLGL